MDEMTVSQKIETNDLCSMNNGYRPLEHAIVTFAVSDLNYAAYTRPLSNKQVNSITSGFDANRFDLPVVSARDGKLWVVDGKQRIEAARRVGFTHIQCRLLTAPSVCEKSECAKDISED